MAAIKSKYKRFNGVAWEEYYFETSVDQVIGLADFIKDNETKLSTNDSTATSGKYISRIQVGDHGLTITKADLPTGFSGDYNDLINKPEIPESAVTSVAMTVPTGLSISGSPITSSGTLALSLTNGYSIPTTAKQTNWDTAFGWGDHKTEGYVKTDTWKPNTDTSEGYVTSGAGQVNKVWKTDALGVPGWRNDDNVDTTYTAGTGLTLSGTTFNHSNSVTAGSVSEGGVTRTLAFGGTFNIPSFNYDAEGHLTGKSNIVLTMPANPNVNNYLTGVSGSGNGTVTFTRQGLSNLTWDATHGHAIGQITNLQTTLDGKQPIDADLTAIAALTGTSGLLRKTAANTWGLDNTSYEVTSNKKTTWGTPTNTEYPSSKLVKDSLDTKEPIIEEGTTAQYWRGDKTWQTLPTPPPTNLGTTYSDTSVTITSSTGNNATINGASSTGAGVVTTGTQTFKGNKTFSDDIVISGDLTVQGENFIANTTTLTTEDDVIELRSSGTTAITTPAGIVVKKYDGTNDGGIVIKNDGEVRIGKVETGVDGAIINDADQAQPVLTRDERSNLTTNRVLMWSGDNKATNLGVGTAGQFLNHLHQWATPVGTVYDLMTNTVLGLGKVFSNTIQTVAANSVSSTASRTYGIQKNSSGQLVVNVPWSDTNTTYTAGANIQISGSNVISATDTKYTSGTGLTLNGTTFAANLIDSTLRSVTAESITTTASRTYAVMPDADGDLVVNVPWVDTNTNTTYTAGTGLTLNGTTFAADLIDSTLRSVTAESITTTASRTYAVMPDADGDLVVNVPWVDTNTNTWNANSLNVAGYVAAPGAVSNKVWKTDGSGNPAWRDDANTIYTAGTNVQISGSNVISATDTIYEHPNITRSDTSNTVNPGYSGTFTAVDSITSNAQGHISAINLKTVTMPPEQTIPEVNNSTITIEAGSGLTTGGNFTLNQTSNKKITLNHSNSITADSSGVGDTTKTLAFSGTLKVPTKVTYDAQGHITGVQEATFTMPANPNVDTRNTVGATNNANKIHLVGVLDANKNTANPQSFVSTNEVSVTNGALYASGKITGAQLEISDMMGWGMEDAGILFKRPGNSNEYRMNMSYGNLNLFSNNNRAFTVDTASNLYVGTTNNTNNIYKLTVAGTSKFTDNSIFDKDVSIKEAIKLGSTEQSQIIYNEGTKSIDFIFS